MNQANLKRIVKKILMTLMMKRMKDFKKRLKIKRKRKFTKP